jgi:hypothetical protein
MGGRKIFDESNPLRSFQGRLARSLTYRQSWWRRCDVDEGERIRLTGADDTQIHGTLRFSAKDSAYTTSLALAHAKVTVCADQSCKAETDPCHLAPIDGDLLFDALTLGVGLLALVVRLLGKS